MGDIIYVTADQLQPTKRMDVKESVYDRKLPILPRYARLIRHIAVYGVLSARSDQIPLKLLPPAPVTEGRYLLVKGHGLALAYHVLGMPIPAKHMTPFDFMRGKDKGAEDQLADAKRRMIRAYHMKQCRAARRQREGIRTIDDLMNRQILGEIFALDEKVREIVHARAVRSDEQYRERRAINPKAQQAPVYLDDLMTMSPGTEMLLHDHIRKAEDIIHDYFKKHPVRRNGSQL
jgi:hypothetical protein